MKFRIRTYVVEKLGCEFISQHHAYKVCEPPLLQSQNSIANLTTSKVNLFRIFNFQANRSQRQSCLRKRQRSKVQEPRNRREGPLLKFNKSKKGLVVLHKFEASIFLLQAARLLKLRQHFAALFECLCTCSITSVSSPSGSLPRRRLGERQRC